MPENHKQTPKWKKRVHIALIVFFTLLFLLALVLFIGSEWFASQFDMDFAELLFTLMAPTKGTGTGTVKEILAGSYPVILIAAALLALVFCFLYLRLHGKARKWGERITAVLILCATAASAVYAFRTLKIGDYLESRSGFTTVYEDYYVTPTKSNVIAEGKTRNLIYIYLESMETTYASKEVGGKQDVNNYMPKLTELANAYTSFSDSEALGGFHAPSGTIWTMGALMATTSGVPFSLAIFGEESQNSLTKYKQVVPGLVTLGDMLDAYGYRQEFLCGSNASFAGRDAYFQSHGNYEIYDLSDALDDGYIDEPNDWWGFDDQTLYKIAKDEITRLAAEEEPFNFTMLTVDTHHVAGWVCDLCEEEYGVNRQNTNKTKEKNTRLKNVVACADRQLAEFVEWIQQQDFYENTTVVITGDHPRMDSYLIPNGETLYSRTVYNCFINSAVETENVKNREWSSFDVFPTTLAALGFTVKGDRIALGTNLFSDTPTLCEEKSFDWLDGEISRYSEYYLLHFVNPLG